MPASSSRRCSATSAVRPPAATCRPVPAPDISDGGADTYAYTAKIVVNDYAENLDAIANLLAELDTAPQQVLIEATILQTTLDEANAYGVDFSVIADMDFLDLTEPAVAGQQPDCR